MPDTTDRVALGKYYIQTLDCFSCHSADFKTNDYLVPENSKGYMAGGNKPLNMEGQIIATSNLTPHKTSGIGNWTEEQFIKAVKFGLVENDRALRFPMLPFVYLTDYEIASMYAYLKTLPPVDNKVPRVFYD